MGRYAFEASSSALAGFYSATLAGNCFAVDILNVHAATLYRALDS
jgi:hypothetical protein